MSEYTPGPWESAYGGTSTNGKFQIEEYFIRRPGGDVAIASDIIDPSTSKPSKPNADLLAAAPDLLAALLEIEAHHVEQNRIKGREESRSHTLHIVRAAIAKARGE